MIKAIETVYKGYRFRSRLEARWAVFFDALGVAWEYEKEGFDLGEDGWYLPDFWLPDMGIWVEIKPADASLDEKQKAYKLSASLKGGVLLLEGSPGVDQVEPGIELFKYSFNPTLFCGECHDTYNVPCCFITDFYHWSAAQFESLRRMLCEEQPNYISSEEWQSRPFFVNDEMGRRRTLVEMDRLFFLRKYGREHWRWALGRNESVNLRVTKYGRDKGALYLDESTHHLDSEAMHDSILSAFTAARSARFEHGETP